MACIWLLIKVRLSVPVLETMMGHPELWLEKEPSRIKESALGALEAIQELLVLLCGWS